MKCTLLALASVLIGSTACAQTLQQGQPAPAALLEQLKSVPVTTVGTQSVRAVPPAPALRTRAANAPAPEAASTVVVREGDNLVGISAHELVVVGSDLAGMSATIASLQLAGATLRSYPHLGLLVVKTARFEQLERVRSQVAAAFPSAQFDLPVVYFRRKLR